MVCFFKRFFSLTTVLLFAVILTSQFSHSKVKLNSMCYASFEDNVDSLESLNIKGSDRLNEKFELASISKVVTAYWALSVFGPQHRFETKVIVYNRHGVKANLHIIGAADPLFGREMFYFLTSELNKIGITEVEKLTFDENFRLNWKVLELESGVASHRSIIFHPLSVERTLKNMVNEPFDEERYTKLRTKTKKLFGIDMLIKSQIKYQEVKYLNSKDFSINSIDNDWQVYSIKSVPLYQIIKQMNLVSHNSIADHLWIAAGKIDLSEKGNVFEDPGIKVDWEDVNSKYTFRLKANASREFAKFMFTKLNLAVDEIEFINGSGDSEYGAKSKIYNKASCSAMIKIITTLKILMKNNNLDLKNIMAVAGVEKSTLGSSRYAAFSESIIAKTGSVDPAITLAGEINTKSGVVIFTALQHTDSDADWTEARDLIREEIAKIYIKFKNMKPIDYTPMQLVSLDSQSTLVKLEQRDFEQSNLENNLP